MFSHSLINNDPLPRPLVLTMRFVILPDAKQASMMCLIPLRIRFDIEIRATLPPQLYTHIYFIRIGMFIMPPLSRFILVQINECFLFEVSL